MERTFCGFNRSKMNQILNTVCEMNDKLEDLSNEEYEAYQVAIKCVAQILNRMADNKPINWD